MKPTARHVFLLIMMGANTKSEIIRFSGLNERTVRDSIKEIEEHGYIKFDRVKGKIEQIRDGKIFHPQTMVKFSTPQQRKSVEKQAVKSEKRKKHNFGFSDNNIICINQNINNNTPFPHAHTHTHAHTHVGAQAQAQTEVLITETKPNQIMNISEKYQDEIYGSDELKSELQNAYDSYLKDGREVDSKIIERFLLYWGERNKKGVERWRLEKKKKGTFQVKSRLARFLMNDFNSHKKEQNYNDSKGRLIGSEKINYNEL